MKRTTWWFTVLTILTTMLIGTALSPAGAAPKPRPLPPRDFAKAALPDPRAAAPVQDRLRPAKATSGGTATAPAIGPLASIGYVATWDQDRGIASVGKAGAAMTMVSPSWYAPATDGSIVKQAPTVPDDDATVTRLRASGAKVVPAIANISGGAWSGSLASGLMANPTLRSAHVANIVTLVTARGFDGIDVDYEQLPATDRANLVSFVTELASALHARGKLVTIAVPPKTSEPGSWSGVQAFDYAALGAVVDQLRVMMYDYSYETSAPGPLAPISWVRQVTAFAAGAVTPSKVVMGVGTYGYDWPAKGAGTALMWDSAVALAAKYRATVQYDTTMEAPYFVYYPAKRNRHTVWFENARSIAAKRAVMREFGLGGMHYWRLGGEDPAIWTLA